ncbi:hypothetical protein DL767_000011 [Monosporascus sp. MG133]|nr:hypothetical protein DL767_000011 [Monosporascus sp. MG133]
MAPYSTSMRLPTAVLAVNTCGLALSFVALALRFWARFIRRVKMRLCDYTIIASWLFTLGLIISENYCVTHGGIGQSVTTVTPDQLLFSAKQFIVIGVCGTLAVTLVKVSILDFFLSIFSTDSHFRTAAYILMGITASYGVAFTTATLASCRPFEANWDKLSHPDYRCINTSRFYVAQAAIGAVLDCLVLLLPVPVVWSLALKNSKKFSLTFLFTIGIFVCAISITRLVYNTQETWMLTHFTEYAGIAALLGGLEANLTIVCACLPSIPTLFSLFAEKIKSTLGSGTGGFKGLLSIFSFTSPRPTRGSIKLGSSPHRERNRSLTRNRRAPDSTRDRADGIP